jgi:membrane protein
MVLSSCLIQRVVSNNGHVVFSTFSVCSLLYRGSSIWSSIQRCSLNLWNRSHSAGDALAGSNRVSDKCPKLESLVGWHDTDMNSNSNSDLATTIALYFSRLIQTLSVFPWRTTAAVLRERFREDQLGLTASSLTFTTMIALVPLFTLALALFTVFPMFAKMQGVLQQWLISSLIPPDIARNVLGYLSQFSSKASHMGALGLGFFLASALALIFTIDRTLNNIWRVKRRRLVAQRVLIYWAAITLGPLILAASLTITSYLISVSKTWVSGAPGGLSFLLSFVQFILIASGITALFRFVPDTNVRWSHAGTGGLFVAVGLEIAKKLLSLYLASVPTYAAVYGAFATAPILLLWIYIAWAIVLLGAVISAYLPSLLRGVARRGGTPGWQFQLCIETIQHLHSAKGSDTKGVTIEQLAGLTMVDNLQLEPILEALIFEDYVGELADGTGRYLLLCELENIALSPLIEKLLIAESPSLKSFLMRSGMASLTGADVLQNDRVR